VLAARRLLLSVIAVLPGLAATACGSGSAASGGGAPTVVVTYSILGDVVRQLVGDAATVQVIIPDGQDPHEYEPSAKDVEAIQHATLVVANGFDLEEGLAGVIEQAADDGVEVFVATDHLTVRTLGDAEPAGDHGAEGHGEEGHGEEGHGRR
jgi:zinc/manganese transport system substrate-binding protein